MLNGVLNNFWLLFCSLFYPKLIFKLDFQFLYYNLGFWGFGVLGFWGFGVGIAYPSQRILSQWEFCNNRLELLA